MRECRVARSLLHWHRSIVGITAFACLGLLIAPGARAAVDFQGGEDCWVTNGATTTVDLGTFPANFFNCGTKHSLAFTPGPIPMSGAAPVVCNCAPPTITWTNAHGSPVNAGDKHAVNSTATQASGDTCVRRKSNVILNAGVPTNIPIEILALHIRSTNPLAVPMDDLTTCFYQIDITLDGSTQAQGSITLTPGTNPHDGTVNLTSLPVGAQVSYTPTSGCCGHGVTPASDTFTNSTGTYHVNDVFPSMGTVGAAALIGLILVGMIVVLWRRRVSADA